ncbi:MAG: tyrosine--tRNA ligase [Phycisphaerales bacterium]|nr:tyrosine--tRNA ligase [Phycisphaerales bacterium]
MNPTSPTSNTTPTPAVELKSSFLQDMHARGMIHQSSDLKELDAHLTSGVRKAYAGFDPTADSLTIGNLVTVMALARFQIHGHQPIALMGGGTGLIGDPSGKSAERTLMTEETVRSNVESIQRSLDNVWKAAHAKAESKGIKPQPLTTVNNIDWLKGLSYLDALRNIGKHFSVNQMIVRDSVKDRLNNREQGISYTEFSYMILQAYDYKHLHNNEAVTLQMGGSDQWGNILSGLDLIHRRSSVEEIVRSATVLMLQSTIQKDVCISDEMIKKSRQLSALGDRLANGHQSAFGLTWPLVTKADGGKFGKTESGAVWLSPKRTSPYAYYQFWLNAADADVERFLKVFTFIDVEEIVALMQRHAANPGAREAQRTLAQHATDILHGFTERQKAEQAAQALFAGDIVSLPIETLRDALAAAPTTQHPRAQLEGEGVALIDLLPQTSLCKSKTEARTFLTDGSISVNGTKATLADRLTPTNLLGNELIALRRGKKNWHVTRWS